MFFQRVKTPGLGTTRFVALKTPDHTPESVSCAAYVKDAGDQCWGVFIMLPDLLGMGLAAFLAVFVPLLVLGLIMIAQLAP